MIWILAIAATVVIAVIPRRGKEITDMPMMSRLMAAAVADTHNRRWRR